ncbi:MAG: low temperature requirement protein A [Nocardioides sp.]|uniref:low temperature requirement protein A n=1 Tax=Nocardioides sp. TaxID=35761 RepID=UPI0039E40E3C
MTGPTGAPRGPSQPGMPDVPRHARTRMRGRDPDEDARVATPLELLYDLTFVVAVGVAAEHMAELVVAGKVGAGVLGFGFGMVAILVAWINFSWFASAFDTDDWVYRLWTMLQMVGVVLVALGLVPMFHSLSEGHAFDCHLIVVGYVVMRIGLVAQWLRVAREAEEYRTVALRNVVSILVAQVGWVAIALRDLGIGASFALIVPLGVIELLIPVFAQGGASGTPWHPHHIAERYGLFAIIALGEGVVGTVASSQGALGGVTGKDWSLDAVLVLVAGVGLTFGLWWSYFLTPFAALIHARPATGYVFGYGHIPLLGAIAGTGAGLHVAGLYLAERVADEAHAIGQVGVTLAVAVPVAVFVAVKEAVVSAMAGRVDPRDLGIHLLVLAVLALAVLVGAASMPWALVLVMVATFVPVVGYELRAPGQR